MAMIEPVEILKIISALATILTVLFASKYVSLLFIGKDQKKRIDDARKYLRENGYQELLIIWPIEEDKDVAQAMMDIPGSAWMSKDGELLLMKVGSPPGKRKLKLVVCDE